MNLNGLLMILIVFFPFAAAGVSFLTGRRNKLQRDYFVIAAAAIEFLMVLSLNLFNQANVTTVVIPYILQLGLGFEADGFRVVYGTIASFMWLVTLIFSREYFAHYRNRNRYYLFQLITLGATEGVFLSADLYTIFVFFEIMSFASYVWVAQDERKASLRAAITYLAVAVIGGLVMLMGLFLLYHQAGTLRIDALYEACQGINVWPAALLMFFGFGAKAGAFPLHIWLPKAHPVAPAPASALLSGILTKTGIFGVLVISCKILYHNGYWGTFVLGIGTLTMIAGAVLAVFSIDFKRTLASSSVSQIGFILVGIGMQGLLGKENALAVDGSFLHMMNHSLFKLVLFLVAGAIYMNLHKLDLNEIRGFGRKKPLLAAIYASGALGIGGFPLFSGYVSKTLIHESIVEYMELLNKGEASRFLLGYSDMKIIEWAFLISGGMTVAYMLKLFAAVFLEENLSCEVQARYDALSGKYMNKANAAVLTICAALFPLFGMTAHHTMDRIAGMTHGFMGLAEAHHISYFAFGNLKGGMISILIGLVIYFGFIRLALMKKTADGRKEYVNYWPKHLDLEDYLYRPVLLEMLPALCTLVFGTLDQLFNTLAKALHISGYAEASFFDTLKDPVVIFMKEHVYTEEGVKPLELEEGNTFTTLVGRILNLIKWILNHTVRRKNPKKKDYVHQSALWYTAFKESLGLISRSLSYGLLLFCIGLCATLIYLLFMLQKMQ